MPETTDAVNGNQIPRTRAAVAQGVECRETRTEQRRRADRLQLRWHAREGRSKGQHVGGISTVTRDSRGTKNHLASKGIAPAAAIAATTGAAVPTDTDPSTDRPSLDSRTQRVDRTNNLVSRDAGIGESGHVPFDRDRVAMTNATGVNSQSNLIWAR